MNWKAIFTWLIVVMIAVGGCAPTATESPTMEPTTTEPPVTEAPTTEEPTEPPTTEEPTAPPTAIGGPATKCLAVAEPVPTETSPTELPPATEAPVTETPVDSVPPEEPAVPTVDKPFLAFSELVQGAFVQGVPQEDLQQIIGYTFPAEESNWTIPIKVASLVEIEPQPPSDLTVVGFAEIGGLGSAEADVYQVSIDLGSGAGQLLSLTTNNITEVNFACIPQVLNPARGENAQIDAFASLDPAPDGATAISANSVCFVLNVNASGEDPRYIRYCSQPGSILSVRDNFEQYVNLVDSIAGSVDLLIGSEFLESGFSIQDNIQSDHIISEMEDPQRLVDCAEQIPAAESTEVLQEECSSDITVAPLTEEYFMQKYDEAKNPSTSQSSQFLMLSLLAPRLQVASPFAVPVAVVQIHEPIETTLGVVDPGNYRLDYWYQQIDGNDVFYAATISGLRTDNTSVTNQQVPAVPATFVNEDGSDQPGAQISTCRIFGRCTFFQSSCS